MRRNVARAGDLIGTVLEDGAVPIRDRLLAARMALDALGRLKEIPPSSYRVDTWEIIVSWTAKRAAELLDRDDELEREQSPGQSWAAAGLTRESFEDVRRLRSSPARTRAYCDALLEDLEREVDEIDLSAFEDQEEDPGTNEPELSGS
jgi:hypothetical protein